MTTRVGSASLLGLRRSRLHGLGGARLDGLRIVLLEGVVLLDRLLVLGHALLEALDALGHVTHDRRDLAAAAEQQEGNGQEDQPVPDAQATHVSVTPLRRSAALSPFGRHYRRKAPP